MSKDEKTTAVMSGYLEKKGKMKVVSSWKTQWFVLKERLLLYYRSKDEYEALSPCKGSINLGPNCCVKPCSGTSCVFQIETRANTILLKAKSRLEQEKWLQAILVAINQSSTSSTGMAHFRYSSGDLQQQIKEETKHGLLTRQLTVPGSQKLDVRQPNNCGSFDYFKKRKSSDKLKTQDTPNSLPKERTSEIINNDLYFQNNERHSSPPKERTAQQRLSQIISNDLYTLAKEPEPDYNVVDIRTKQIESNLYERISTHDDIIPDYVATNVKSQEKFKRFNDTNPEHLYERISSSSNESNHPKIDEGVIFENDQYCTPDIKINETKHFNYHEYTIPQLDNDLYSIPNIDQNDNKLSTTTNQPVNPYSICHIYPKKTETVAEVLYDDPLVYVAPKEDKEVITEDVKKLSNDQVEEKPNLPKKKSFLRNFFKLKNRKKTSDNDTDKTGDIFLNKTVLEELQQLLENKRHKLEMIMNTPEQSTSFMNMEEAIYQEISEMIPHLQMQKNDRKLTKGASCKIEPKTLKTIDDILNDLDDMKRNKQDVTCRVKALIKKFDNTSLENMNKLIDEEVTIRQKNEDIVDNTLYGFTQDPRVSEAKRTSSDELNKLLSELVKVTNAPLMEPGVTTSLGISNCTDKEFRSLEKLKLRRHSDPDYDIPRPHSNLNIPKEELKKDDVLVATRFFGPVLTGNEGISHFSTPMVSMAPDSLEIQNSSYNSHCYANVKMIRQHVTQKHFNMEESRQDDVFVDSLEPFYNFKHE